MNTRSQSGRENRQRIPPRGATGSRGRGRGTRGRGDRVTPQSDSREATIENESRHSSPEAIPPPDRRAALRAEAERLRAEAKAREIEQEEAELPGRGTVIFCGQRIPTCIAP